MQIPVNFLQVSCKHHACLQSEQRDKAYAVMHVCYAAPSLAYSPLLRAALAVRAACGVAPPCRVRVRSTRTDSQRLAARRGGPKGAFRGTCARSVDVSCHAKSRVAVSSGRGQHAPRCPSTARCVADSHSCAVGRGEASQGGLAISVLVSLPSKLSPSTVAVL